jgi:hypothetical protein
MMKNVHVKLNPGLLSQKQHSTERRFFSPPNWTKFEEEPSKVQQLEHSFVWYVDTTEIRSEMPGKF